MANVKFIFAFVLLLAFAFSHAVNSVEGRHLKIGMTKVSNKKPITPTEKIETSSTKVGENISSLRGVSKEFKPAAALVHMEATEDANPAVPLINSPSPPPPPGQTEGFRPTAPGHSPGIGHSH
ncbi:precursor of CEP3-like [Macadamia integrifolia]|uniref:precursor of CEP3-like n=1 Tax=Macadamia integrifolia TaxID=60698 RepID=UPI001C4F4A8D|nr:precursor of CEP3-like [Macadamia integrifolia]